MFCTGSTSAPTYRSPERQPNSIMLALWEDPRGWTRTQGHGDGPVAVSGAGSWCQLHTNEESAPFPQTPQADSVRGGMHVFGSSRVTAMRVHSLPTVIHSPNTPKLAGVQARCQALQERGSTVAELAFMVRESWRLGPALVGGQGEKQTEIAHSWLASDSPKHSSRVFGNQGASSSQDG